MLFALLLSVIAVVYNNVVNQWKAFHSWAYIPTNLVFAGAVAGVSIWSLALSRSDLGLRGDVSDLFLPIAIVSLFALILFAMARSGHLHRIADRRVAGLRGAALLYYALVRIPVGTAVAEEVLFRGVIFEAWQQAGASIFFAASASSAAFGLWHVAPTIIGLRMNDPDASRKKVATAVAGAVVLTTIAGLGLTWLRVWTDGLLGPIALHAGINATAALDAARQWDRANEEPSQRGSIQPQRPRGESARI